MAIQSLQWWGSTDHPHPHRSDMWAPCLLQLGAGEVTWWIQRTCAERSYSQYFYVFHLLQEFTNPIADRLVIDVDNPYNPARVSLKTTKGKIGIPRNVNIKNVPITRDSIHVHMLC